MTPAGIDCEIIANKVKGQLHLPLIGRHNLENGSGVQTSAVSLTGLRTEPDLADQCFRASGPRPTSCSPYRHFRPAFSRNRAGRQHCSSTAHLAQHPHGTDHGANLGCAAEDIGRKTRNVRFNLAVRTLFRVGRECIHNRWHSGSITRRSPSARASSSRLRLCR